MTIKLTDRQQQILDLIRKAVISTGFPPTRAEIAQQLGFKSANAAEDHLRALARKGVIELTAGASRGIRLTEAAADFFGELEMDPELVRAPKGNIGTETHHAAPASIPTNPPGMGQILLPLIGRVAAGFSIQAIENIEKEVQVDIHMFTQIPDYLLKVKGMSMRDIGILDGDLLAVKKTSVARNGQIVVARIDDEVTVKRLNQQGKRIELLPENSDFEPIVVSEDQHFSIEGLAMGLIRTTPLQ